LNVLFAVMAELADALASGASDSNIVEVRVLLTAYTALYVVQAKALLPEEPFFI
jgi:hypothetical protein